MRSRRPRASSTAGARSQAALHCDLIIAREDALITDLHIALDRFTPGLPPTGVVPGDGGTVILPLQMRLAKAKEFLFTGKPVTAKQLVQMTWDNDQVAIVHHGDMREIQQSKAGMGKLTVEQKVREHDRGQKAAREGRPRSWSEPWALPLRIR
jgi:enoyl-CoA hydratase/carnithine racemase